MVRNGAVKINKGLNVITFYAEERDASYNGGIYYGIDYIDFTKAYDELTAPQMYLNQEMNVGDTISAIIMDGSKIVTPDTVYQLTFKSDNEEVASVDGSGLVKGVSAGTATITAAIRANRASEEIVLKQTVTVNGDTTELASVKNVKNDNGKISFDVTSSFGIDTAQAYVASYDNGVLVSVKLQEISVGANGSVTVEKTLDNYNSSQNVKIFVWLDQYPLTGCVEVQ
ncbi:MAG TPA: Ig-like domain-containing protein [Candidatus Ornithomonoglobus intestinigallinarum]|uniref:Ig-like domain-containing protein n=1 Tax=Candidatus Ornithomonoglobus intestinigallinarum TaxID=2840894 RepID=A0A9D1H2J0_9FIRM|nr:Ig-like domain-containing protein [Candidatus Ornithomonoglobus intestinigallinarum]